jgi:hypothetical protein
VIFDLYSKRKKSREKSGHKDVYKYDDLPEPLRVQIIHIWSDAIGGFRTPRDMDMFATYSPRQNNSAWEFICQTMCRELGVFSLGDESTPYGQCQDFLLHADIEKALDLIELSFRYIDRVIREMPDYEMRQAGITQKSDDAIEELNARFKQHGVGYQFVSGEIVRVDSQFIHSEVIKPAIGLLKSAGFKGAEKEFLSAHEHYRHGRGKEALNDALKALESTLKTICDRESWGYPPKATANALIDIVFRNGFISKELQAHFNALRTTLESGVPTVRNSTSAHGQGVEPVEVPMHLVAYGIHLSGAAIVMLVEAGKS